MYQCVVRFVVFGAAAAALVGSPLAIGCAAVEATHGDAGAGGAGARTGSGGRPGGGFGGGTTTMCAPGMGGPTCMLRIPEGCGDGINNQAGIEACDDGNTLPGDGCNGACQVEPNWSCPSAGACTRKFRCGDGTVNPGEVCDDGNATDGDGCGATCAVQDPRYTCMPGVRCVLAAACGNRRVEPGESCDDGNGNPNDGCSAVCALEPEWVCPVPGSPCMRAARCGDGVVNVTVGEVCDDGNNDNGDGCSADCRVVDAGCSCVPGKRCTCPEVRCGNGTIEGSERCDDGNATSGDGCSEACAIERGYVCPLTHAPCVPSCGDGIVVGNEQCDPGVNVPNIRMACSATCRWNAGWACTGNPPTECHAAPCGDNKKEGLEGCDDGNTTPFDGCSADCQNEPACPNGACSSKCGDGVRLGEACDDGNNAPGDGCSATCTVESGYTCMPPELGDHIDVPIIYRDFLEAHPDFEQNAQNQMAAVTRLVNAQLDADGKPVYAGAGGAASATAGFITSQQTFAQWYRTTANVNHATPTKLRLWNNKMGAYVNRYGANGEPWPLTTKAYFCGGVGQERKDAMGQPIPCTFQFGDADCDKMAAMGYPMIGGCMIENGSYTAIFQTGALDGTPVFFPVDGDNFTPAAERAPAGISPPYGNYEMEAGKPLHNFSFTSEVRYWFPYDSTKTYTLDFLGDDDVWVFVNRRLAVDLGGIHTPVQGAITISAANAASLGMTNGNVYEIVVFQAEREKNASSYKLTLAGFNGATTACGPTCGDSVVAPGEQCDNGPRNVGGYNQCTPDCRLGPYCGDGMVTAPDEDCDNGRNNDAYGAGTGCGPGCRLPARCGDMLVQGEYGESCDDGVNDGRYGGCTRQCQRAPYCGDAKVQADAGETCDDGVNDGSYGTCGDASMPLPNCGAAPRCGDGVVQDEYGEQCEPTSSNDPECTIACRRPGGCGDGNVTPPEQCDYGASANTGDYGGCAPGCILAPHCGDAVKNGPEECDDGILDNRYGGCSAQCKLAPHCGDGKVDMGYETCDHGADNGLDNLCSSACKLIII